MPNILLTGVATLDIINHVEQYPAEDSEVRACAQEIRSGGNAANSAIVMQQLGINTSLMAQFADDLQASLVLSQLHAQGVDTSRCPVQHDSTTPTSYISLSRQTGSRTIVHYRQLDELHAASFVQQELSDFDWFHFEGRNCEQLQTMLEHTRQYQKPVSIELEKPRDHIDLVLPHADVLLISRPYAEHLGFADAVQCLQHFAAQYDDKTMTCTWGAEGAWMYHAGQFHHQPAIQPDPLVETLGAGDTFNAGLISCLSRQQSPLEALEFASRLASRKCQQSGLLNLY